MFTIVLSLILGSTLVTWRNVNETCFIIFDVIFIGLLSINDTIGVHLKVLKVAIRFTSPFSQSNNWINYLIYTRTENLIRWFQITRFYWLRNSNFIFFAIFKVDPSRMASDLFQTRSHVSKHATCGYSSLLLIPGRPTYGISAISFIVNSIAAIYLVAEFARQAGFLWNALLPHVEGI